MEVVLERLIKILTLISNDLNNAKDAQLKDDHKYTIKTIKETIDYLDKPLTVSGDIILLDPDDAYDKGNRHVEKIKCRIFDFGYDEMYIDLLEGEHKGQQAVLTNNSILDPLPPFNHTLVPPLRSNHKFMTNDSPPREGTIRYIRFNEHEKNLYDQRIKDTSTSKSNYVFKYNVIFDDGTSDLSFPETNMKEIDPY
jgi:hypothetical protein